MTTKAPPQALQPPSLPPHPLSSSLPHPRPPRCRQAHAQHTHTPPAASAPRTSCICFASTGLEWGHAALSQLAASSHPLPPTEVPYVSVMNKHEAPWLGGWEVAAANHLLSGGVAYGGSEGWGVSLLSEGRAGGMAWQRPGKGDGQSMVTGPHRRDTSPGDPCAFLKTKKTQKAWWTVWGGQSPRVLPLRLLVACVPAGQPTPPPPGCPSSPRPPASSCAPQRGSI